MRVCGEVLQEAHGSLLSPAEQGVVLALRSSHHQGPFTLATVAFDQRCHKGLPLRVPMMLPEECFGGSSFRVPGMQCFPGFPLKGGIKGDMKGRH